MSWSISKAGPGTFAIIDAAWLLLLVALLAARGFNWLQAAAISDPLGGLVWLIVPWAGALGGVTISLVGVCRRYGSWDPRHNFWHLFRPALGAIFGVFGVLVVTLIVGSVSGVSATTNWSELESPEVALLAVFAFVSGYRESTVRELMKTVWDTIFTPKDGKTPDVEAVMTVEPAELAFGGVGVTRTVVIRNATDKDVTIAEIRGPQDQSFHVLGDQSNATILPGSAYQIAIEHTHQPLPAAPQAQLTVVLSNGEGLVVELNP